MKLLSASEGWVLSGTLGRRTLLWTTTAGREWTEITPPAAQCVSTAIRSAFFLNTHLGWALFDRYRNFQDDALEEIDLASTRDSGTTWSTMPVKIPAEYTDKKALRGSGSLYFADSEHAWIGIGFEDLGSGGYGSLGLATSDAGITWHQVEIPGPFMFLNAQVGWAVVNGMRVGGSGRIELQVTRDGGSNWTEVRVDALHPQTQCSALTLPIFEDATRGFFAATGCVSDDELAVVLFETTDRGETWRRSRVLNVGPERLNQVTSTVVNSDWIVAYQDPSSATLAVRGAQGKQEHDISNYLRDESMRYINPPGPLSFATSNDGWMQGNARLLATSDGGASWSQIGGRLPSRMRRSSGSPARLVHPLEPAGVDSNNWKKPNEAK
jgi:photosystem II stability/assembly factor-like uncharacterized protein